MASEQIVSQRRFTVIELPVLRIVAQSLMLPFQYLPELVKFGWIPFALILVTDAIVYALQREDVSRILTGILMATMHFILFTPFSVAWTKLAIKGRPAVANHPPFGYSRTQWLYLLASTVMIIALTLCIGIPAAIVRHGQQNFDNQVATMGGVFMVAGFFLFVIGYIRLGFIFPAIAVGRYAGISAAWKQTAGNFERLVAILVLTYLPYLVVREVFEWWMGYHPPGFVEAVRGCIDMLLIALATTALAGPALAYKTIVLDEREDSSALSESMRAGG